MRKDRVKKLLSKKLFDDIEIFRDGQSFTVRGMWGERYFERQTSDGRIIKTAKPHFLISSEDGRLLKKGDLAHFDGKKVSISALNESGTGFCEVELREEYEGDLSMGEDTELEKGSYLDKLKRIDR